jgi:hypothetical protein
VNDSQASLTLLAGGDVAPLLQPVDQFAELIQPTLDTVDFRFLQCERTYSHRGSWPDWQTIPAGHWTRLDPEYASVFKAARADVVSVASNHALDFGWEALEDTIELFTSWGMKVVGGGTNQAEAHKPVILEKDGVRVAILASRMSFSIATTSGSIASDMISGGQPGWKSIGTYQVLARRPATPG